MTQTQKLKEKFDEIDIMLSYHRRELKKYSIGVLAIDQTVKKIARGEEAATVILF